MKKDFTIKSNKLIAMCGRNPQVITEALYCLSVDKCVEFQSITIITTASCSKGLLDILNSEINKMSKMYSIELPYISKPELIICDDSPNDNKRSEVHKLITNNIFAKILCESAEQNTAVHCLISGGFKTMSADAAIAMMLFGRSWDKMYHILASSEFEKSGKFFPENADEANQLELIDKPFLRLRSKIYPEELRTYDYEQIIETTQKHIDSIAELPYLQLDIKNRMLKIGEVSISLSPLHFAIYVYFSKQRNFIRGGKNFPDSESRKIWELYSKISPSYGQTERVKESSMQNEVLEFEVVQKAISTINKRIRIALSNSPTAENYLIKAIGTYADKQYGIMLSKDKIKKMKK